MRIGNFWLNRFGAIVLLAAIIVSAVNVLSLSGSAKIVPLTTDTANPALYDQAAYQRAADKILASSALNRNKLTLDSARLSRELKSQFPELSDVTVTVPLLAHRPLVYVHASKPAVILAASSGSYVVNAAGKVLVPSTQVPNIDKLNLPLVGDQSGVPVRVGKQALTSDNIRFIQIVTSQLNAKGHQVASMILPAVASELDVQVTGKPYFIKFNLQSNSARQQAGTYLATDAQLTKQNITPAKYIDVRVDGRSYYQ
jgi:cell division septal protein FtsQ